MKIYLVLLGMITILSTTVLQVHEKEPGNLSTAALDWFHQQSDIFSSRALQLQEALGQLGRDHPASLQNAVDAFKSCRMQYKKFAFFLEYFFPDQAYIYNGPPVPEVDPYEDEVVDPAGLQVIGSMLFTANPYPDKMKMIQQAEMLHRSSETARLLLGDFKATDQDILKSMRRELIRIITLYITGYDAPEIKTGIEEAYVALAAMDTVLGSYAGKPEMEMIRDTVMHYLRAGEGYLKMHADFDSFDRLVFITRYTRPVEKWLKRLIAETGQEQRDLSALNPDADYLFSPSALDRNAFPHTEDQNDPRIVQLGKQFFSEKALSGNGIRSCSFCHSPDHYFMDGLARNKTIEGDADLPRNTPGLLYAGYQYAQFWDGRASGLEAQINTVLNNPSEMNSSAAVICKRLSNNPVYAEAYKAIWPSDSAIRLDRIEGALAAYIRTLAPFSSAFDHYMQGDFSAMTPNEQNGFNLFMGKARCGSCHFAPLFNGLLPPEYASTEFEILGTTADDHFEKPKLDSDQGRYDFFPVPLNKRSFKTPTVRNAAVTGPYMHNGRFTSLEKVIDFYDSGGGAGMGLNVLEQTLASDSLHLTGQEKADLIAFIKALTDK
jgi:cytochrome c peroxidase